MHYSGTLHTKCWKIFLFCFLCTPSRAQDFVFNHVTAANGLSENSVYAILKDREGFMWIGTQGGLNRYDGERCKAYKHIHNDSLSLSDNFIISLAEDSSGYIWVGTRHGLNRFDKKTQTFRHFFFEDIAINSFHQRIHQVICMPSGEVYFSTDNHCYVLYSFDDYQIHQSLLSDSVSCIAYDKNECIIVSKGNALYVVSQKAVESHYTLPVFSKIISILPDGNTYWLGTDSGLWSFNRQIKQFTKTALKHNNNVSINALCKDGKGRIWLATNKGVSILQANGETIHLREDPQHPDGLSSDKVLTFYNDQSGLLWIGTLYGDVNIYDTYAEAFRTMNKNIMQNNAMVWSILEDHNTTLWVGSSKGLFMMHCSKNTRRKANYPGDTSCITASQFHHPQLDDKRITSLIEDRTGQLWIGTRPHGVFVLNLKTQQWKHFLHDAGDSTSLVGNEISIVYESRDGTVWIGTTTGLCTFDSKSQRFQRVRLYNLSRTREIKYIISLLEDSHKEMWVSTSYGVIVVNGQNHSQRMYTSESENESSLSYNIVSSCYEDKKQRMWVTTLGNGINKYDRGTGSFKRFSTQQGLIDDVVYGIVEDNRGYLWMSTNDGLSCLHPDEEQFYNFGAADGLSFTEFSQNAYARNSAGDLFFGGVKGLLMVQSESVHFPSEEPPFMLTDIKINYKSLLISDTTIVTGSFSLPEEIHLTYEHKALTLDFIALNYRAQKTTQYTYRLEGFDNDWVYPPEHQRTAHYTHLSSGEYMFVVRSKMKNGKWSDDRLRIPIFVHPPFWNEIWFVGITVSFAFACTVFGARQLSNRKLKQKLIEIKYQQQLQSDRERISRELHDSTGANLAGIITGLDVAEKHLGQSPLKTKRILRSLTKDARLSIAQLRETIWALKTNTMSTAQFAETVREYITHQVQYKRTLQFKMLFHEKDTRLLTPIQVLNLFRIVQEAVANVIKHSNAKHLVIEICVKGNALDVAIQDDGTTKKSKEKALLSGQGLSNMERRAKELNGTMHYSHQSGAGACVSVHIPLQVNR
ncbi:MAG: two-component regulator propeller domain-containing protein [bacterium]